MKIIDSIYLTLLNAFDIIDWRLAKLTNYYLELKGGVETSAISFFSFILSLIVGCFSVYIFEKTIIIIVTILSFLLFDYLLDKRYSERKNELKERLKNSFYLNKNFRITVTILFLLFPFFQFILLI